MPQGVALEIEVQLELLRACSGFVSALSLDICANKNSLMLMGG